jgi:hypothetical protein
MESNSMRFRSVVFNRLVRLTVFVVCCTTVVLLISCTDARF